METEVRPTVRICFPARSSWSTSALKLPKCLNPHLGQGIGQKLPRRLCAFGFNASMQNGTGLNDRVGGSQPKPRVKTFWSNVTWSIGVSSLRGHIRNLDGLC